MYWVRSIPFSLFMYLKEKQYKIAMILLCPVQGPWASSLLLLWNRWTEFNETWQEARSQRLLPSLCFVGWSEKQEGRPSLWLAETFSTSPLKPLNRIRQNLTGSNYIMISMAFTKSVFFRPIGKKKMAAMAHDWLRHFWLLLWNCWTGFKEICQEARSQHLLPSFVFQSDE